MVATILVRMVMLIPFMQAAVSGMQRVVGIGKNLGIKQRPEIAGFGRERL